MSLSPAALLHNFRLLNKLSAGQELIPMIKADGYGHGAEWTARTLLTQKSIYGFGVAALREAEELRRKLGKALARHRLLVFSGSAHWTEDKAQFFRRMKLIPVISSWEDWKSFQKSGQGLEYHIKFDTGMNRMGVPFNQAEEFLLSLHPSKVKNKILPPAGMLSHLAVSEDPQHPTSRLQLQRFKHLCQLFEQKYPQCLRHLANSGALWNSSQFELNKLTQLVRPGLSLYGIPPWSGATQYTLKAVMRVQLPLIQMRWLHPGESLGYGSTFTCPKEARQAMRIGVLGGGYADGLSRALSNVGDWIYCRGHKLSVLGTTSMDLTSVQIPSALKCSLGTRVEVLGPHVDAWKRAQAQSVTPYELLTFYGSRSRVERKYV